MPPSRRLVRLPVERLDENVDRPAARETDRERVVVGVPEADHAPPVVAGQHGQGLLDDGPFDAASRYRPRDLARVVHHHGRARVARPRSFDAHDPRHRDPAAIGTPAFDVVEDLPHFVITAARFSSDASEWPSTNSSTYGSAAAIPRASGTNPGDALRGLTQTTRCATRARRAICSASCAGSPRSQPSERITTTAPRAIPRTPQRSLNSR